MTSADARCGECKWWHQLANKRYPYRGVCEIDAEDGGYPYRDARLVVAGDGSFGDCEVFERARPLWAWKTCPKCGAEFLARAWETECPGCRGSERHG